MGTTSGRGDVAACPEEASVAIKRKSVTISVNGVEYLELDAGARQASLTIPAYVRARCGLEPWSARGREMHGRAHSANCRTVTALDRLGVTITVTEAERADLEARATAAGLSISQYIRTRCGFQVRWTSLPNTEERDREEDDAWERLRRLGLTPEEYFPEESA